MRSPPKLLIVDDSTADAELTGEILSRTQHPHRIAYVGDGIEAMAHLRQQGKHASASIPDVVILDLNLPLLDGTSVLAQMKFDPALRLIPVIIFSTSQANKDILRSYELGANGYISKPGNLSEFTAAVQSIGDFWLGSARYPKEQP